MGANNNLRLPTYKSGFWLKNYWNRHEQSQQYFNELRQIKNRDYKHERITTVKLWEYYPNNISIKHYELLSSISQLYSVQLYTKTVLDAAGQRINSVEVIGYRIDVKWAVRHLHQLLLGYDISYKFLCQYYTKSNRKLRYNGKVGNIPARTRASLRLHDEYKIMLLKLDLYTRAGFSDTLSDAFRKKDVAEFVLINKSLDLTAHLNSAITIRLKLATAPTKSWKTRKIINPWAL